MMSGVFILLCRLAQIDSSLELDASIKFLGNVTYSSGSLRDAAVDEFSDLESKGYRKSDVDDAAFQIEGYYRSQGFAFAEVDYDYTKRGTTVSVTFQVREGPRASIKRISIEGLHAFEEDELKNLVASTRGGFLGRGDLYYVESEVKGAPSTIESLYVGYGYLDVRVEPPELQFSDDKTQVTITLRVNEGSQYIIRDIRFDGSSSLPNERLSSAAHALVEQPFFTRRLFEVKAGLEEVFGNEGFVAAQITVTRTSEKSDPDVDLVVTIDEGVRIRIRQILIEGNEKTNESFIRHRLTFASGDIFRTRERRESFSRLYATGLFERIEIELVGDEAQRDVKVTVSEANSKEFSATPGYGSYERIRLEIGFRERNLFGTGRILRAETELSLLNQSMVVGITDPWVLGSDYSLDLPVSYRHREEPSFALKEVGAGLIVSRRITRALSASVGYNIKSSKATNIEVEDEDSESFRIAFLRVEPKWDTRDNFINPTTGVRTSLALEYGDSRLGSNLEFFRARFSFSSYVALSQATVVAFGARSGFIAPIRDTDEIPIQERMFNGGESTVRSFRESRLGPLDEFDNPRGGEVMNILNLEVRQSLWGNLHGALFLDYGNVAADFDDYFRTFSSGVGAGLRYLLPIGAVRLDGAFNPDRREDQDAFALHLSVGMAF